MDEDLSRGRDPFTDSSFDIFNPGLDYARSDRDIRHKFNFFGLTNYCRDYRHSNSRL